MIKSRKLKVVGAALFALSLFTFAVNFTSCSNGSKDTDTEIDDDDDDEEEQGVPSTLFTNFNSQIDAQIWVSGSTPTAEISDQNYAVITAGSYGWWGVVYCYDASLGGDDAIAAKKSYDMSAVKNISFKVKGSKSGKIKIGSDYANAQADDVTEIAVTTEWAEKTVAVSKTTSADYGVLCIIASTGFTTAGRKLYIGDVTFLDAERNPVTPTCNY